MNLDNMDLSRKTEFDYFSKEFVLREVFGRKTFCTIAGHQACGLDISECSEPECVVRLIHES